MTALTEMDWGLIFAKAWIDPEFKAKFEKDPRATITEYAKELNLDPNATFSFSDMPEGMTEEKAKSIVEGTTKPEPMYCC